MSQDKNSKSGGAGRSTGRTPQTESSFNKFINEMDKNEIKLNVALQKMKAGAFPHELKQYEALAKRHLTALIDGRSRYSSLLNSGDLSKQIRQTRALIRDTYRAGGGEEPLSSGIGNNSPDVLDLRNPQTRHLR